MKNKKLLGSLIVSFILLVIYALNALSIPELKLQDMAYQKPSMTDPNIVVIGIDDESLAEFGRYQDWSRQSMADAINILNSGEEKPAVIAIDFVYAEVSSDKSADDALVEAAENGGNVVLASLANTGYDIYQGIYAVTDYIPPFPELADVTLNGLANGIPEEDSVVRYAWLVTEYEGEKIYGFPYQIYKSYMGEELPFAETYREAYITYYGMPGDYKQASFADIFAEDFDPDFYAGAIVMIGPFAAGMMDAYNSPVSGTAQMYGVEIHANALQTLLEGNFKQTLPVGVGYAVIIAVIVLALLSSELIKDIRARLAVTILLGALYVFAALWAFKSGYILSILYPVLSLAVLYIYDLVYGYIIETLEKQRVKSAFKKYVDPSLVDKLMETGEANSDEVGQKKHIAVLFVDVRGFTPMTEAMKGEPELVVKILNEYLELTSSAVFNNGGSVDKFIGDATMALFNGFVPLDDYEFNAVKAAWDIVQGAADVNASIKEKYGVDVGFGVGVNSGDAIVGNLGPSFRKDYTAIGDTVNTAARLEANAKRSQVLISAHLFEKVKDRVEAVSVGEIPLKGKSDKLEIFSVTGIAE